jgi:hypothetical protein
VLGRKEEWNEKGLRKGRKTAIIEGMIVRT